eukprot:TRINITY_DN8323_c0_g1_i1.p1 TRINITY_DN8323_c0_g1~~TRINITY_DN8323_c0_g1_i1.p1  ORF type:complete len:725 (+),score=33.86 TRINITY_DN8323_c0_g1_i1:67-2175(+)
MAHAAAPAAPGAGCSATATSREASVQSLPNFHLLDQAWPSDEREFRQRWETTAGLMGLLNAGGTCTVNAAAQGLLSLPPVLQWLDRAVPSGTTVPRWRLRVRQALLDLKRLQDAARFQWIVPRDLLRAFYTANLGRQFEPGDVQSVDEFLIRMAEDISLPVRLYGCLTICCHVCPDGHRYEAPQRQPIDVNVLWFRVPNRQMVTDHTLPAEIFSLQEVVDTCLQPQDAGTNLLIAAHLERAGGQAHHIPEEKACDHCARAGRPHGRLRARLELGMIPKSFSVVLTRTPDVHSGVGSSGGDVRRPLLLNYKVDFGNHSVDLQRHLSPACGAEGPATYKLAAVLTRLDYDRQPQGNSVTLDTRMGHNVATVRRTAQSGQDIFIHMDDGSVSVKPQDYVLPDQPAVLLFTRVEEDGTCLRGLPQPPRGDAGGGPPGQPPSPSAAGMVSRLDPQVIREMILARAATLCPGWVLGHAVAPLRRDQGRGVLTLEEVISMLQVREHQREDVQRVWDELCADDARARAAERPRGRPSRDRPDRGRPHGSRPDRSRPHGSHPDRSRPDGTNNSQRLGAGAPFRVVVVAKLDAPIHRIIAVNVYFPAVPSWSLLDLMVRLQLQSEASAMLMNQHLRPDRAELHAMTSLSQLWRMRPNDRQWGPIRAEDLQELASGDYVWAQLAAWQRPPDPSEIPMPSRPAGLVTSLPQQHR